MKFIFFIILLIKIFLTNCQNEGDNYQDEGQTIKRNAQKLSKKRKSHNPEQTPPIYAFLSDSE